MRLSRTRGFRTNIGNYESFDFSASVTLDHMDLGYTDEDRPDIAVLEEELTEAVMGILDRQLYAEIEEGRSISSADKSVLLDAFRPRSTRTRTRKRTT